jgi:hypothetical protein
VGAKCSLVAAYSREPVSLTVLKRVHDNVLSVDEVASMATLLYIGHDSPSLISTATRTISPHALTIFLSCEVNILQFVFLT